MLVIYKEGISYALLETDIYNQFTRVGNRISSPLFSAVKFNSGLLSVQLILSYRLQAPTGKREGCLQQVNIKKVRPRLNIISKVIELGLSGHPSSPVKAKMECCKSLDRFVTVSKTAQPPEALRVTTHGERVSSLVLGRVLNICRRAFGVFYYPYE